jgi:hypothetical protein
MNNGKNIVIGLGGYAGAGKDLFCELLQERIDIERYALADELKLDMREQLMKSHDIDVLNCSRKDKDKVRHLLVDYGSEKRKRTNGRYWTDKLTEKILPIKSNICITDIRYAYYHEDEDWWLKNQLNGYLVWIDQHKVDVGEGAWEYVKPPNEEEKINGPKLKSKADYIVDWEYIQGNKSALGGHVDTFTKWLNDQETR